MVTRFVIRPVIAGLAVWLAVTPVLANGWEHWGVPLDILLATLGAEEPGYRMRAARSLGVRQEPRAVAPMLARLADADERPVGILALGRHDGASVCGEEADTLGTGSPERGDDVPVGAPGPPTFKR